MNRAVERLIEWHDGHLLFGGLLHFPFSIINLDSLDITLTLFQPVDLLPFRLQDARRELEDNGDFTIEALHLLRKAEDERRELLDQCRDLRNQLILEQDEDSNSNSSNPDEITTDRYHFDVLNFRAKN